MAHRVTSRIAAVRDRDGQLEIELSIPCPTSLGQRMESYVVLSREALGRAATRPRVAEAQESWGVEIAGYLYLAGLGAGAFIVAVVLDWLGLALAPAYVSPLGDWIWDWSKVLVLWGPVIAAVGASLNILHLGRNRSLFFTACLNPRSSWLARGFIVLFSFVTIGCAVAAAAVLFPHIRADTIVIWRTVEAIGVACALGTAIYTGILIKSKEFIPAWHSPIVPFLFVASALSTGSMGVVVGSTIYRFLAADLASAYEIVHTVNIFVLVVLVAESALLALYLRALAKGKPEGILSARMLLSGSWRYPFWIGIVAAGRVLPFVLVLANIWIGSDVIAILAALSVLAGGFVLRLVILGVGVEEAPPLYRKSEWRVQHALVEPGALESASGVRAAVTML